MGKSFISKFENQGKGGDHHKHLQMMIKDQAKVLGWKAVIEEKISRSLESIDVGLNREEVNAAIEISASSKVNYEIQNIRKGLEAGYDYILSVSEDKNILEKIKSESRKTFTHKERDRIRFFHPDHVKNFLININSGSIVSEKGIVSDLITNKNQLFDTETAAEYLGIKKSTLYEWVVQRKVPFTKVGRLLKFRIGDLDKWIEKRTKEEQDYSN